MNWVDEVLKWIGGIGVPVLGGYTAYLAVKFSRKTGAEQVEVSAASVKVDEKEANTHEFAVMIEGFTAQVRQANDLLLAKGKELTGARDELTTARDELQEARRENADLRAKQAHLSQQQVEMLFHMFQLELLIPNPPGPPRRPAEWTPYPPTRPSPTIPPE